MDVLARAEAVLCLDAALLLAIVGLLLALASAWPRFARVLMTVTLIGSALLLAAAAFLCL